MTDPTTTTTTGAGAGAGEGEANEPPPSDVEVLRWRKLDKPDGEMRAVLSGFLLRRWDGTRWWPTFDPKIAAEAEERLAAEVLRLRARLAAREVERDGMLQATSNMEQRAEALKAGKFEKIQERLTEQLMAAEAERDRANGLLRRARMELPSFAPITKEVAAHLATAPEVKR